MEVLLIEDNPGDSRLVKEMLKEPRFVEFNITNSTRLDQALNLLESRCFEVILLDLGLPDSQGLETYRKLCSKAGDTPVVILTGLNDESIALKAIQEGAQDYLVKCEMSSSILSRLIQYAVERKKVNQELMENEQLLRNILENSTNLFYSLSDELKFTYVSPQIKSFLGYDPDEIINLSFSQFTNDNPLNLLATDHRRQALETKTIQPVYEQELRKKNGMLIWVEVHEVPIEENGKISIVGALTDVSDRKKAEADRENYHQHLEKQVQERTTKLKKQNEELERMNRLFIGREFRIKELRDEIKALKDKYTES